MYHITIAFGNITFSYLWIHFQIKGIMVNLKIISWFVILSNGCIALGQNGNALNIGNRNDESIIRTMSYNMYGWNALQQNPWKANNMYQAIKAFSPDLLGTQEIENLAQQVADNIGNDYAVAGYSAGHAILYRTTVFDLISSGHENIHEQDQWGQRTVEYAQLNHKTTGKMVDHFNTHFCVCSDSDLVKSAHTVEETMQKHRRPGSLLILTGDLNVFHGYENSETIQYFKGNLNGDSPPYILEDSFRVTNDGNEDGTTFPGAGKLDYIFVEKGADVITANIDTTWYGDASDHLPINAVIELNQSKNYYYIIIMIIII